MKKSFLLITSACSMLLSYSQVKPKLVVGIMIDQMRWDYLYRYQDRFGPDGFRRLMKQGLNCENTFIPFTPTYTAAGHACVYTGSVPSLHGIISNAWYSKELRRLVYCTEDDSVQTVGSTGTAGKQSPKNMWANTISDEMRLSNNFRSKTIAIAIKDRGSILPGGHSSNGSYWFDNGSGGFITSSFYMKTLPAWVVNFNAKKLPDFYLNQEWKTLYPLNTYLQSTADAKPYEDAIPGEDNTFEHNLNDIKTNKYESFKFTPGGSTYTFDMGKEAIKSEALGKDAFTDMLALSFSSPDYIGHKFGPNSIEIEDTYLRFDKDLASFLKYLDEAVGKGQYLVFLTADHGVAQIPGFMNENRLPAGTFDNAMIIRQLNDSVKKEFGTTNLIENIANYQVYLNDQILVQSKTPGHVLKNYIIQKLLQYPGISHAVDLGTLNNFTIPEQLKNMLANGYSPRRSGDIQFIFMPQWFDGWNKGTTHGAWNPYDSHIPLIWYGTGINPGKLYREVYMTDIAPTLAALLQIQMPNASIGKVIEEVFAK